MSDWGRSVKALKLTKFLFIAYDFQSMYKILTLNFFRFLDTLCDAKSDGSSSSKELIKKYYDKIAVLGDDALVIFLEELGKNLTDTAEFNFYGSQSTISQKDQRARDL